ncbi:MAG: SAF domain-containing protein [Kineosporiaceae bacterium]
MSDLPAPAAARLRRPSWRDTRLVVGVLLVLASVALGARLVAAADDTVPVYAAATALPAGSAVDPAALRVVRVRLDPATAPYLDAAGPPPTGAVLLRTVGAGELVPAGAVGSARSLTRRPVTLPLDDGVPAGVVVGGRLDVWASARDPEAGAAPRYAEPERLAEGAEVYAVTTDDGSLGAVRTASVQVLLEPDVVRTVLDAFANDARVAVVPVPGAAARTGDGAAGGADGGSSVSGG